MRYKAGELEESDLGMQCIGGVLRTGGSCGTKVGIIKTRKQKSHESAEEIEIHANGFKGKILPSNNLGRTTTFKHTPDLDNGPRAKTDDHILDSHPMGPEIRQHFSPWEAQTGILM